MSAPSCRPSNQSAGVLGVRGVAITDALPSVRQVWPSLAGTTEGTVAEQSRSRLPKPCQRYRRLSGRFSQQHLLASGGQADPPDMVGSEEVGPRSLV